MKYKPHPVLLGETFKEKERARRANLHQCVMQGLVDWSIKNQKVKENGMCKAYQMVMHVKGFSTRDTSVEVDVIIL